MHETRRQLTLFVSDQKGNIEKIRSKFNPIQFKLIAAHVTLCREDEIENLERVLENIKSILLNKPIQIEFESAQRFEDGKGVLIPAKPGNIEFSELRKSVLKGLNEFPREHLPHITMMHPRNSVCTDAILKLITEHDLPTVLHFDQISLIEQRNGEQWNSIEEFSLVKK